MRRYRKVIVVEIPESFNDDEIDEVLDAVDDQIDDYSIEQAANNLDSKAIVDSCWT